MYYQYTKLFIIVFFKKNRTWKLILDKYLTSTNRFWKTNLTQYTCLYIGLNIYNVPPLDIKHNIFNNIKKKFQIGYCKNKI